MSIKRIIIVHLYRPGSAATNRILAYSKGFVECKKEVYLVLVGSGNLEAPVLPGVNVISLDQDKQRISNRMIANTVKSIYLSGISVILVYGTPLICWFLPHSKYNIYYECTEIPYYGMKKSFKSFIKENVKLFFAKRATGMLVISNALKLYFQKNGIKKIEVINMFVDSSRFENVSISKREKSIAYCGWVSEYKDGVDCLIKAFAEFKESNTNFKLYIIGDFISEHDRAVLQQLVEELKLRDYVVFTGKISPKNIPNLLCSADILALARPNNTQARYGFPTKLGEYLSTGNPVVVTNVGEIGCFLEDKVNCIFSTPNNPHDFCESLKWVVSHPTEAMQIAKEGKKTVQKEFSYITQCQKAICFFEKSNINV